MIILQSIIKYSGINLTTTKKSERPVHKNCETLLWKVKDLNKWKDNNIYGLKESVLSVLPKLIYRFKAAPVKQAFLGVEIDKPIPTFIWKHKEPWLSKAILKNKRS